MSDDDLSDLSSILSSAPSEDESDLQLQKKDGILKFFSKIDSAKPSATRKASTPPPEREPSPDHVYVLADNPDIAFIVMFRSRFDLAFPKSLANFGPQELERGVVDTLPAEHVENFLCAVLGLLLNRKQDIKKGHYNRALEEAVSTHKSQWPKDWKDKDGKDKNPLSGGATFTTMSPTERLTLLKTLINWSLSSSDSIRSILATSYKQARHEDDLNQPLSVQPWGSDGHKRRYFLIEGLDDTNFRIYRESNPAGQKRTWFSVAGDIDEVKALAEKLSNEDGGQKARNLSNKMLQAVPRFEATEEKRKRREYRQIRKQQFQRPEPGFSNYEGRTRGKRMKYTFSEDEDEEYSDTTSYTRRSTRNTGTHTPAEGPTVTQSGRQVRSRHGGMYGETLTSEARAPSAPPGGYDGVGDDPDEDGDVVGSRPRRAAAVNHGQNGYAAKGGRHIEGYNSVDDMDDEDDASEQDYGDDEEDGDVSLESDLEDPDDVTDEDEDVEDDLLGTNQPKKQLLVKLPLKTPTPEKQRTGNDVLAPENKMADLTEVAATGLPTATESRPRTPVPVIPAGALTSQPTGEHKANDIKQVVASEPMDIKQPDVIRGSFTPLSPSLAYRGSPDKPHGFSPAINIQGGQ